MEKNKMLHEQFAKYVYICYAHKDNADDNKLVLPIIEKLEKKGVRIWWDKEIKGGELWSKRIDEKIADCTAFLAFMSQNAANSPHCKHEIFVAVDNNKEPTLVYLEPKKNDSGEGVELSNAIRLLTKDYHYFDRNTYKNQDDLVSQLLTSSGVSDCIECVYDKPFMSALYYIFGDVSIQNNGYFLDGDFCHRFGYNAEMAKVLLNKLLNAGFIFQNENTEPGIYFISRDIHDYVLIRSFIDNCECTGETVSYSFKKYYVCVSEGETFEDTQIIAYDDYQTGKRIVYNYPNEKYEYAENDYLILDIQYLTPLGNTDYEEYRTLSFQAFQKSENKVLLAESVKKIKKEIGDEVEKFVTGGSNISKNLYVKNKAHIDISDMPDRFEYSIGLANALDEVIRSFGGEPPLPF